MILRDHKLNAALFLLCLVGAIFWPVLVWADEIILHKAGVDRQFRETQLTEEERAWLTNRKTLVVAVKQGYMPVEFKLDNERHRGIAIDYLTDIANLLRINIKVVPYIEDVNPQNVDIISSINGTSKVIPGFSRLEQPYLRAQYAIYKNKSTKTAYGSLEQLEGARVAIFKSGQLIQKLKEEPSTFKVVPVDIADEALEYLRLGEVDAYIGNEIVIDYHLETHRVAYVEKSGHTPFTAENYMAVSQQQPVLASIMDKTLAFIGENNENILKPWKSADNDAGQLHRLLMVLVSITTVILLISLYRNHKNNITQTRLNQQRIWYQANYDYLTHIPNRHFIHQELECALLGAKNSGKKLGLVFIDLDNFKHVNDSAGHAYGDRLLMEATKRLQKQIRTSDVIGRFGGDEFLLIVPEIVSVIDLYNTCENILQALRQPFVIDDQTFYIGGSIGVSIYPDNTESRDELLIQADLAMHEAKRKGKNRLQVFNDVLQMVHAKRNHIIHDMRDAFMLNQFSLHYQPIISMTSSTVTKAEALVRWHHPERGFIPPDEFVEVAEESGLIAELGRWVLSQAVMDLQVIKKTLGQAFQISLNVSPIEFTEDDYAERFIRLLKEHQIQGNEICIEITEGLLLEPSKTVVQNIERLNAFGIEFSIDDFGTGYSALAYLKRYDIQYVKIDKSFVQKMVTDKNDLVLCETIIQMAHKLDMYIIAEGVEDEHQKAKLEALDCDYIQGFLFARPQPLESFLKTIAQLNVDYKRWLSRLS